MNQVIFIILFFLSTAYSFSQTVVKGKIFRYEEKKICDFLKFKKYTPITSFYLNKKTNNEKNIDSLISADNEGNFTITLKNTYYPDTLFVNGVKEIIIKNEVDTSLLIDMTNYKIEMVSIKTYGYNDLAIFTNSDILYAPYSLGLFINFENPFFKTHLFTSYTYSTNLRQNTFKEFKIGINDYHYNLSVNYTRQEYFYEDNNINLERNIINFTKYCNDLNIYPTMTYSYNIDNINNNSFSAYKISIEKKILSKPYLYLTGGVEYYGNFSYQAGGKISFNIKKLNHLNPVIAINYDTFMNYNLLNASLSFNFINIPYWPFRYRRY